MLWVPVFTLILFLRLTFRTNAATAIRTLLPAMLGAVITFALLTLFRLYYFGYPLPNTFYAKVSPSLSYDLEQGTIYLLRYFQSDSTAAISIFLIFSACLYSSLTRLSTNQGFFLPLIAVTGLLMPILTGGDHFGSFRFYQNTYPIMIFCVMDLLSKAVNHIANHRLLLDWQARNRELLLSSTILLIIPIFLTTQSRVWSQFVPELQEEFSVAQYERTNGIFIQDLFASLPELPSLGVIASGGIKYSYNGEIIDLLGLNNTVMAHNHGDRKGYKNHAAFEVKTFYQLQPDIVWPVRVDGNWQYNAQALKERWENTLSFKGLFDDSHFLELYEYAKVRKATPSENEMALVAWFKKDFLKTIMANENFVVEEYRYIP
jgi:arabinofuranosyltransferase